MKKTNVEILVEDIARSIVDSWLQLDEVSIRFQIDLEKIKESRVYLPKISEGPISMKEEALFDENNFYEQVLDIDSIDNDQQTKNSVFEYYLSEQRAVFELLYPELSSSEIRMNAALCFKSLAKQDKVFYMKKYLKDKIYNNKNGKGGSNQEYYMQHQGNNNAYRFSEIQHNLSIPSLFDRVDNGNSRNEPRIIQQFYSKNDFQGSASRDKSGEQNSGTYKRQCSNSFGYNENRAKPDATKGQSSDKSNTKYDESKQKAQFQTLRSLFKRLQSNI